MDDTRYVISLITLLALLLSVGGATGQGNVQGL